MTRLGACVILAAGLSLSGPALHGCASSRTHESPGEYLDNSVITTKVKTAILEDAELKYFQISVETYKDTVLLSGFVDSARSARRAGEVAASVGGVHAVRNELVVKQ